MPAEPSLRVRLSRPPIVVAPGVYDALTALIAEQAGFGTLYVSGAAIAYSKLGRPDIGLVSMSEVVDTVALIRDRVGADLIVDADTGYGNALNVRRTVRLMERAGATAIQLEDQDFPKRCGHLDGKTLDFRRRDGRQDQGSGRCAPFADTLIVARTDAVAVEGFEAALARAAALSRGRRRRPVRRGAEGEGAARAHRRGRWATRRRSWPTWSRAARPRRCRRRSCNRSASRWSSFRARSRACWRKRQANSTPRSPQTAPASPSARACSISTRSTSSSAPRRCSRSASAIPAKPTPRRGADRKR